MRDLVDGTSTTIRIVAVVVFLAPGLLILTFLAVAGAFREGSEADRDLMAAAGVLSLWFYLGTTACLAAAWLLRS